MGKWSKRMIWLVLIVLVIVVGVWLKNTFTVAVPVDAEEWKDTTNVVIVTTGTTEDGLTYQKYPDKITITGYIGEAAKVVIPEKIDGISVADMEAGAFRELPIEEVIIKAPFTMLSEEAFKDCVLLQNVVLPESLKRIDTAALKGCKQLERIDLPEGLTEIAEEAFCESGLKVFPTAIPVESIGAGAFSRCDNLGCVVLPENVKEIGNRAFADSGRAEIYYAEDARVGTEAFLNTSANMSYTTEADKITICSIETEKAQLEIPANINGKAVAYVMQYANYTDLDIIHTEHYGKNKNVCTICGYSEGIETETQAEKEVIVIYQKVEADVPDTRDETPKDGLHPIKGVVDENQGIITGIKNGDAGDGYSHWQLDENGWWLLYANGGRASGRTVADEKGEEHEVIIWELIDGAWYAFGEDGYAKSGWTFDLTLSSWFYIDINTGMKTGWNFIDGEWYYFNPVSDGMQGKLYKDSVTPDGYQVGKDGEWIE